VPGIHRTSNLAQRSFLFGTNDADTATTRLIATAASATGFMKGEPGRAQAGWYQPDADNSALLHDLRDQLALAYPAAGPALWAVRLWTNLLWQPAYLSVIAVHLHGAVPDFGGLSQARSGIYIDRYRLVAAPMWSGPTEAMIERAAHQLSDMTQAMLREVNEVERLRLLPAQRLLADRMLGLMLWLGQGRRNLRQDQIEDFAGQWMSALQLSGQGTLQHVEAEGRSLLIVKRKGCCLDYLIDPAQICANCPKQDDAVRIRRQVANALAELG
jgi:siderophore ferric iron reductase